jgi:hypothetical protein
MRSAKLLIFATVFVGSGLLLAACEDAIVEVRPENVEESSTPQDTGPVIASKTATACSGAYGVGKGELLIQACDGSTLISGESVTATAVISGLSETGTSFSASYVDSNSCIDDYNLIGSDAGRTSAVPCDSFWDYQFEFGETYLISTASDKVLVRYENTGDSDDARMRLKAGVFSDVDCIGGADCYAGSVGTIVVHDGIMKPNGKFLDFWCVCEKSVDWSVFTTLGGDPADDGDGTINLYYFYDSPDYVPVDWVVED